MKLRAVLLAAFMAAAGSSFGQITILSTPWPTSSDPTAYGELWPGGLIAIVATGLTIPKPVVRAHRDKLPLQLAGISVKVGLGPYRCKQGFVDNPAGDGLDAPILEVADHGDYQQVTVQVPWEYVRYPLQSNGNVCQGASEVSVSQAGATATSAVKGVAPSSHFFLDADGYVRAQHASDLSWVTAANPAHPGEQLIIPAINLGWVVNPPPTGRVTSQYVSTVISETGQTNGPVGLDLAHVIVFFHVFDDIGNGLAGLSAEGATLTPGAVSRYQVPVRLPSDIRPSAHYLLSYDWRYCPHGPFATLCSDIQTAGGSSYQWPIHIVTP